MLPLGMDAYQTRTTKTNIETLVIQMSMGSRRSESSTMRSGTVGTMVGVVGAGTLSWPVSSTGSKKDHRWPR
jgi:hypothetical protein